MKREKEIFEMKIAITGGIGSGKSLVGKIIKRIGYPVFSCDDIYREMMQENSYIEQISKLFPDVVKKGEIDKKALSEKVFSCEKSLEKLNRLAHPLIMERLYRQMKQAGKGLVFSEVPLLFEGGYEKDFDRVIVVIRNLSDRIQAVCERDRVSKKSVEERISKQFDYDRALTQLTENYIVLKNDGDISTLQTAVEELLSKL